jgi:hypothetical protein
MQMQSSSRRGAHLAQQKQKAYVLFRVYGLESGRVGVKLYVDPERARKDGQLEFEADGWIITPKAIGPGAAADSAWSRGAGECADHGGFGL